MKRSNSFWGFVAALIIIKLALIAAIGYILLHFVGKFW